MKLDAESLGKQSLLCTEHRAKCAQRADTLRARLSGQSEEWSAEADLWDAEANRLWALKGEIEKHCAWVGEALDEINLLKEQSERVGVELASLRGKLDRYERLSEQAEQVRDATPPPSPVRLRPARVAAILAGV